MNIVPTETTVGDIVRLHPARARVFEHLGIDYCCGGKIPLAEACRAKGLDPATVVAMLGALDTAREAPSANPDGMTLSELCDHIERNHHDYLREELPRLDFLTRKVAAVHGDSEPRLREIRQVFQKFHVNVDSHTQDEERFVFPTIRRLDGSGERPDSQTLNSIFSKLEHEHDEAGAALAQFRALTDDFTPPEWACNTFRALYETLATLESNMHQHVHKENNVLFPKARAAA